MIVLEGLGQARFVGPVADQFSKADVTNLTRATAFLTEDELVDKKIITGVEKWEYPKEFRWDKYVVPPPIPWEEPEFESVLIKRDAQRILEKRSEAGLSDATVLGMNVGGLILVGIGLTCGAFGIAKKKTVPTVIAGAILAAGILRTR